MTVKCLIIDDEPLAIEAIEDYILKLEGFKVVGRCQDALEAFALIKHEKPDLVFLDIEMPELSGIEFIKTLKNPPRIIFTTAYREYAADAFDMDVIDYLLKPIGFARFMRAIDRFYENYNTTNVHTQMVTISDEKFLAVYTNGRTHKIELEKIRYIESLGDYLKIHLTDGRLTTRESISSIGQKLPETMFLRIHRSYIVSWPKIDSYTSTSIQIGEDTLPISRKYKGEIIMKLNIRK
jgi:two-component system, LytTR family, response regulator